MSVDPKRQWMTVRGEAIALSHRTASITADHAIARCGIARNTPNADLTQQKPIGYRICPKCQRVQHLLKRQRRSPSPDRAKALRRTTARKGQIPKPISTERLLTLSKNQAKRALCVVETSRTGSTDAKIYLEGGMRVARLLLQEPHVSRVEVQTFDGRTIFSQAADKPTAPPLAARGLAPNHGGRAGHERKTYPGLLGKVDGPHRRASAPQPEPLGWSRDLPA